MSSVFFSFLFKTNFLFHKNHFLFLQKLGEVKKSSVLALSLCRSRQILGSICRPIKGSQLTPHVQVRLTCLSSNIHVFLFKQISCLQSVVCEYIPLFYGLLVFPLCMLWVLCIFQLWKCYRTGARCYICNLCCIYGSGCLYIILCRAAPNICGNHLRWNNKDI